MVSCRVFLSVPDRSLPGSLVLAACRRGALAPALAARAGAMAGAGHGAAPAASSASAVLHRGGPAIVVRVHVHVIHVPIVIPGAGLSVSSEHIQFSSLFRTPFPLFS